MRVFVIVGLLIITSSAFGGPRQKFAEKTQRDDALAMFGYTLTYHAYDAVCKEAKTYDAKDNCVRALWALWREVYAADKRTGAFNHDFHRFSKWLMSQIRDKMILYRPPERR